MADERTKYTDALLDTEFRVLRSEVDRLSRLLNGMPGEVVEIKADLRYVREDCAETKAMVHGDQPTKMRRGDWISLGLFLCAAAGTTVAIITGLAT